MNALKYFICTNGMKYLRKEYLVGSMLPFLSESTNILLTSLNVGSSG